MIRLSKSSPQRTPKHQLERFIAALRSKFEYIVLAALSVCYFVCVCVCALFANRTLEGTNIFFPTDYADSSILPNKEDYRKLFNRKSRKIGTRDPVRK